MAEAVTWRAGLPRAEDNSGSFRQYRDIVSFCSGEGVGWYYFFGVLFYSG